MLNGLQELAVNEDQVTNGAANTINLEEPYIITVSVVGSADLLFHAWNVEAIAEKAASRKGSTAKKTDDIESYVYRDADGNLGIPGPNFVASIVTAAKYVQDPRSPRKSAMDLAKAGVVALTDIAPFECGPNGEDRTTKWDYEDARRVTIQRAGITRVRPAMRKGWRLTYDILITLPEYMEPDWVLKRINDAGRLCGVGDFRPTYGRFNVVGFKVNVHHG
jgi:hypothetical protein